MSRVVVRPLKTFGPSSPPGPSPILVNSLFFSGLSTLPLTPQSLLPSGGAPPYTYSAIGLPAGVVIAPLTGTISGTPALSGITIATATVTDSAAAFASVPVFFDFTVGSFADSFARVDEPFYIGNSWYTVFTNTEINALSGPQLSANINVAGGVQLTLGGIGAVLCSGGTCYFIPRPLDPALTLMNQFSEMRLNSHNPVLANNSGPAVFINPNNENSYWINYSGIPSNAQLTRGMSALTPLAPAFLVADGDVLRLDVTLDVGFVTVRTFKNGVLQDTVVDASPGQIRSGMPGIAYWGNALNGGSGWNNFSCGAI